MTTASQKSKDKLIPIIVASLLTFVSTIIVTWLTFYTNIAERVRSLEVELESIKLHQRDYSNLSERVRAIEVKQGFNNFPNNFKRASDINMDETETLSGLRLLSPIRVKWMIQRNMIVQVYKEGNLKPLYDKQHASGGAMIGLEPGQYEIKIWIPGEHSPYKNVWVEVID